MTILAGFEVGRVANGTHCLVEGTGHSPSAQMRSHYGIVQAHGINMVRDGLPYWESIAPRMQLARSQGMDVIWDLDHWWRHPDPTGYVKQVIAAVNDVCPFDSFCVCFNELWVHEHFCGQSFGEVVQQSKAMLATLRANLHNVQLYTAEPAHHPHELDAHEPWRDEANVIGLNLYPHELHWDVSAALIAAWHRFGKPVMITETSLNPHHPQRWRGIATKTEWLRYCLDEIAKAQAAGVDVRGLCWYPIIDSPWWGNPALPRWPHGLIQSDLTVDAEFATAILALA